MPDPMKVRATFNGKQTEVKILMAHEMETGQRKDSSGVLVPAHFIKEVVVVHNDKTVLSCDIGTAISRNPFFSFRFKGGTVGDKITVTWVDNGGATRTDSTNIASPAV